MQLCARVLGILHYLDERGALIGGRLDRHKLFKIFEVVFAAGSFGSVRAVMHADEGPPMNRARRVASKAAAAPLGQNCARRGQQDKRDDRHG